MPRDDEVAGRQAGGRTARPSEASEFPVHSRAPSASLCSSTHSGARLWREIPAQPRRRLLHLPRAVRGRRQQQLGRRDHLVGQVEHAVVAAAAAGAAFEGLADERVHLAGRPPGGRLPAAHLTARTARRTPTPIRTRAFRFPGGGGNNMRRGGPRPRPAPVACRQTPRLALPRRGARARWTRRRGRGSGQLAARFPCRTHGAQAKDSAYCASTSRSRSSPTVSA